MSIMLRNNIKFFKFYRLRISKNVCLDQFRNYFRLSNPNSNFIHCRQSILNESKLFATAAPKINDYETGNVIKIEKNVDDALNEIDFAVKRTGRTVLESVNEIFQKIENIGYATETQSIYLLRCCSFLHLETPTKRVELANKMWNKFKALGIPLNVKHFNALLKVYLTCQKNFSPSDFLVLMENHNVEPNKVTYTYLIEKYCQDGNLTGANEVLEFIKEKEIYVNEAMFNSLIKGHVKNDDFSGAEKIMEVMRNSGISPSSLSYTILACRYAEKGNVEKVEEIISEAENIGIFLQNTDYLEVISSMAALEQTEYIEKLLNKLDNVLDWRQDVINTAAELVHVGADKLAHKLIMTISIENYYIASNIFIKTLIKNKIPLERILEYSTEFYEKGINSYIFTNASRMCMDCGNLDYALAFFNEMQKRGIPVRIRNFRPFLSAYKDSPEGFWKVIKSMSQFGFPLDVFTLEEYVIPATTKESPEAIISKLQECGQSLSPALHVLFQHYCSIGDIEHASYLIENYPVYVFLNFNFDQFLLHYRKFNRNPNTYFKVLKHILENIDVSGQDFAIFQGEQLALFLERNPIIFEAFHKSPVGMTCNYHEDSLEICRRIIRKKNPSLMSKLSRFSLNENQHRKPTKTVAAEDEQRILNSSFDENPYKQTQLMELLSIHIQNRDVDRVDKVLNELDKLKASLPPTLLVSLFSYQCDVSTLEAAQATYNKIKELYPSFKIESSKIFDYARLLLKFSKTDECLNLIKNDCQELKILYGIGSVNRSLKRFLNNVVQTGDVDLAKMIQVSLIGSVESPELKEIVLEPVLKIYLHREDFETSLKEASDCVTNHKCFPCQHLFMVKLIKINDHDKLQSVINLASKLETESKALNKLAVVCVEMGRFQQATKILQNLGPNINFSYLEDVAQKYFYENQGKLLENLLLSASGLRHNNKLEGVLNMFLKLLEKKNDFKKLAMVMDFIKNENIEPSSDSKMIINKLFLKNGQSAAFETISKDTDSNPGQIPIKEEISNFFSILDQRNAMEALKELERMKKGLIRTIPLKKMSELVELLLEKNCLTAISTNVNAMSYIIENSPFIFKPLLEKISQKGNVEKMIDLAHVFPDFSMKKSFFNSFLARAYIASDRTEDLLSHLENAAEKKNKFFSVVAFEELLKIPHLEERILDLSKRYLEMNFDLPLAVIWSHYFVSERYEKASEISKVSPIQVEKIDSTILRSIQQNENFEMGKRYIEFLSQLTVRDRTKERAYGTLLDLYVLKGMQEEAVNLVMEARSKNVDLQKHYHSTLSTLKSSLERENKSVPFNVEEVVF